MVTATTVYRFQQRIYTLQKIRESGFRDGCDGTRCYPPRCWGFDDDEECLKSHPADKVYLEGYEAGKAYRADFFGRKAETTTTTEV
jgi:hypothetical protein